MNLQAARAGGFDAFSGNELCWRAYENAVVPVQALLEWAYQCGPDLKLRNQFENLLTWIEVVRRAYEKAHILLQSGDKIKKYVDDTEKALLMGPEPNATPRIRMEMTVEERDSLMKRRHDIYESIRNDANYTIKLAHDFLNQWESIRDHSVDSIDKWYLTAMNDIKEYAPVLRRNILEAVRETNANELLEVGDDKSKQKYFATKFDDRFHSEVVKKLESIMRQRLAHIFDELRALFNEIKCCHREAKFRSAVIWKSTEFISADIADLNCKIDVSEVYEPLNNVRLYATTFIFEFIKKFCDSLDALFTKIQEEDKAECS